MEHLPVEPVIRRDHPVLGEQRRGPLAAAPAQRRGGRRVGGQAEDRLGQRRVVAGGGEQPGLTLARRPRRRPRPEWPRTGSPAAIASIERQGDPLADAGQQAAGRRPRSSRATSVRRPSRRTCPPRPRAATCSADRRLLRALADQDQPGAGTCRATRPMARTAVAWSLSGSSRATCRIDQVVRGRGPARGGRRRDRRLRRGEGGQVDAVVDHLDPAGRDPLVVDQRPPDRFAHAHHPVAPAAAGGGWRRSACAGGSPGTSARAR